MPDNIALIRSTKLKEIFHMSEIKKEILEQFIRLQGLLHRYHTQHFMEFGPMGNPHRGQCLSDGYPGSISPGRQRVNELFRHS